MTRAQKIEEKFFKLLMVLSTFFILAVLAVIIYSIFEKGIRSISWEMLTPDPARRLLLREKRRHPQCHPGIALTRLRRYGAGICHRHAGGAVPECLSHQA